MSKLNLHKDRKTGEPLEKKLVSAKKARQLNYLEVKAYDDEREVEQTSIDLGEK